MSLVKLVPLLLPAFFLLTLPLPGQEFRAVITGHVMDPTGAVIPGATVTVISVDTKQAYTAKSDASGVYTILYLLPGRYTILVEAAGFQRTNYSNVILESAQKLSLNVTMALGSVEQEVTVTASPGLLESATASIGGVVDQARVENMPSTGRQVWMDLAFTQGIRLTNNGFDTTPRNNGDRYTVNGSPVDSNAFYLNGAPVSDQGVWYFVPNQDAVQELQGGTSYDAQYGRAAGGSFNVNVKAGTNRLRGAVYDNFGHEALNANSVQNNRAGIKKSLNRRHTFGGVVGGPIRTDKTFFFASYEGFRQNFPTTPQGSVPPMDWRTGNFSQSGYNIYDPVSTTCTRTNPQGQCSLYGRSQFPGNIIPASRINPIGRAITNLYPEPTNPGVRNNYVVPGARDFMYDQYIGRIDQNFSANTRLYGLFTYQKNGNHGPGNAFTNVATTKTVTGGKNITSILSLTRVISPTLVSDLRLSFVRYTSWTITGTAIQEKFTGDKIGGLQMPLVPSTTHLNVVPQIAVNGYTTLFGNTQNGSINNDWDFGANLAHIRGPHNLRYGFEFMNVQSGDSGIPGRPNGTFTFNPNWTQSNPQAATTGHGLGPATLLLGYPSSGSVSWDSNLYVSYHYYGLYVQDDFKAGKNVTLNLGLRWDVNKSPSERFNRINAGFCFSCENPYTSKIDYGRFPNLQRPLRGGLMFAGAGAPRTPFQVQWHNWQPRFGVSWAATPKMVFRAGYGIYYSWGRLATDSIGFNQSTPYISSLDGNLTPTNYFFSGRPFPDGVLAPAGSSLGLATQAGQGITYASPDRRIPHTQHWSIGLQRALRGQIALGIEYAGSHTHGLPLSTSWDTISWDQQAACFKDNAICNTNVPNPFFGVVPAAAPLGASQVIRAWQLTRPYPLFNGVTQSDNPCGESDYHALQVRLERKIRSANFILNYTYSNWMDETRFLNNGEFIDPKPWRGLNTADRRHYISFNGVLPLPFGEGGSLARGASGIWGALLNHWLLDSSIIWGTGTPLEIPAANFYGPGCTSYMPAGGQTAAQWINNDLSCYHNLQPWEARTTPLSVGAMRDPARFNFNGAVHKRFALPREGMFIQFRVEAVNAANHPGYGGPNLTVSAKPSFTPWVGWTGFGTLPLNQDGTARVLITSLKILF